MKRKEKKERKKERKGEKGKISRFNKSWPIWESLEGATLRENILNWEIRDIGWKGWLVSICFYFPFQSLYHRWLFFSNTHELPACCFKCPSIQFSCFSNKKRSTRNSTRLNAFRVVIKWTPPDNVWKRSRGYYAYRVELFLNNEISSLLPCIYHNCKL